LNPLLQACAWLYDQPWATAIRESEVSFPAIETLHVLSLMVMVGTIAIVDLRILGLVLRREPADQISAALLPATWVGFALMATTGAALFAAEAIDMYVNPAFRWKLALLAVAGANMVIFHFTRYRRRSRWSSSLALPWSARTAAALSLATWSAVIIAGRAIAYFHHHS